MRQSNEITLTPPVSINCVVLGARQVGKTSMIKAYTEGCCSFETDCVDVDDNYMDEDHTTDEIKTPLPDVLEKYEATVMMGDKAHYYRVLFSLQDTLGGSIRSSLPLLNSLSPDVLILCFSLIDESSLPYLLHLHEKILKKEYHNTPKILVGTKVDLRDQFPNSVSSRSVDELITCLQPSAYIECSGVSGTNLKHLFTSATSLGLSSFNSKTNTSSTLKSHSSGAQLKDKRDSKRKPKIRSRLFKRPISACEIM
eukprot:TRINITY_DN7864_c0_g1_i1.p1 TRINITY_DN7864_c0_g1~~TRINITY_DN7864_c0_g1_i1.p1  ORF type:complete len:254 (+),score=40.61 TRINITY_DN7864_c0_g1_i1:135-896(+)